MELNTILLRQQRDELLKATDKYMLPDYPITPEQLVLIKEYRQQLRDYMNKPEVLNCNPTTSNLPLPSFPEFQF